MPAGKELVRKSECEKRKLKKYFTLKRKRGRLRARLQANMDDQTLEDYISFSPYINLSFATESMLF